MADSTEGGEASLAGSTGREVKAARETTLVLVSRSCTAAKPLRRRAVTNSSAITP